jgi:ABC-type nickel/cobalt efflux system permease component RcnA
MTRIVHRFVVRTWGLAFLLAVVATVGAAREAAAHSLGPKFFAQQITVKMDAEWLRIAYTIEVPTSILQREFVDMAKDKMDAPPAEIREEFKRSKVDALRTGLDVSLNREHLTLEDDPDGVRESRPNDMYFQLYRYALRTKIAGKLADRNVLAIKNRNYPGEETLYSEHVELGDGLGEARTGLEKDERFFLDSKTNTKWYPSPEHRNLSIDFTRKGVALPEAAGAPAAAAPVPGQAAASDDKAAARTSHEVKRMESYLGAANLSVSVVLVGLAVAFFLGCGHALSPGHGKTVVAAYLVGSKGRIRDAVFLGTVVTATHTSVVILLGVITLSLSQYVLPEKIYPYLGFTSGALIVGLGFWMLVIRLRAMMGGGHTHGHGHADHDHHLHDHTHGHDHAHDRDHGHDHAHDHPPHAHDHGHLHDHGDGHVHAHFPDPSQPVTWKSLLSLGISGGMVPCPSALVVLLAAVAYHRVAFGLALVLSFSLGLALVLIAIGIAMVLAGNFMQDRFGVRESPWVKRLPVISAAIVILFGLGICGKVLIDEGILSIHL